MKKGEVEEAVKGKERRGDTRDKEKGDVRVERGKRGGRKV